MADEKALIFFFRECHVRSDSPSLGEIAFLRDRGDPCLRTRPVEASSNYHRTEGMRVPRHASLIVQSFEAV
jgi:hypothetical protein